jgi:non-canonical purine NTP pyrophosphatase (RdgB/HAM1 family)
MNNKLVFATNNKHKLREVKDIVSGNFQIVSLADIHCEEDIPETADTLEGNALLKADYVKEQYGYDCFADDTGLEVEALNGAPGVYSARYAGTAHDSQANMMKLLHQMHGQTNRKARFRTVIALIMNDTTHLFEGIIEGQITESPRGDKGFGYDPVFVPDGFTETFAELGDAIKNTVSHRAKAVHALAKFLTTLCLLLAVIAINAQKVGEWRTYLASYNTTAVAEANNMVFGMADGSLYSYGKDDNRVTFYSRLTGLSENDIKLIGYNPAVKMLLIAYTNGNIDLMGEDGIYNLPFLKNAGNIADKEPLDVYFNNERAYLSCRFGIVVIQMDKREVAETYRFNQPAYSVCIMGETIYASTDEGLRRGNLRDNLLDNNNWSLVSLNSPDVNVKNIRQLALFQDRLCFRVDGGGVFYLETDGTVKTIIKHTGLTGMVLLPGYLAAHTASTLYLFNTLNRYESVNVGVISNVSALTNNADFWIAGGINGIIGIKRKAENQFETAVSGLNIDGPKRNLTASLTLHGEKLLITGGGFVFDRFNNPGTLMTYENGIWTNFDENQIIPKIGYGIRDFTSVAVDPDDDTHYFVSSFGEGIFEVKDNQFITLHNHLNSALQSVLPNQSISDRYVRVCYVAFDKDKNLWATNRAGRNVMVVRTPDGQWAALTYPGLIESSIVDKILFTSTNMKWLNVPHATGINGGILVVDDNGTPTDNSDDQSFYYDNLRTAGTNNIHGTKFYCIVEDLTGKIWIGSNSGPIICQSPNNIDNLLFTHIIREDDNFVPYYFLDGEQINTIAVDGGNRKWIGTAGSGLFLVSPEGDRTILHFDMNNSPLYSNNIQSIVIDSNTGEVFIGTDKGLISYQGDATEPSADYSDVYAYPNPVRPEIDDRVVITGLMSNSNVKITDLSGNLIHQGTSAGGQFVWNCRTRTGSRVATGIYLVLSSTPQAAESVVTKIAVVH